MADEPKTTTKAAEPVPVPALTPASVPEPTAAPASFPPDFAAQFAAAMQGEAERARLRDMNALAAQRHAEDQARDAAPKTKLVAICAFTINDGVSPLGGRVVQPGEEFEISTFDLQKYAGKAVPRAPEPLTGGVTVSSGPSAQP